MTGIRSVILERGVAVAAPALFMFSIFLLVSGHNRPGGGFAGGLVAAVVIVLSSLAGRPVPFSGRTAMGLGLSLAAVTGLVPVFLGGAVFDAAIGTVTLPLFGEVKVPSVLAFDAGVYLVVVGMTRVIIAAFSNETEPA